MTRQQTLASVAAGAIGAVALATARRRRRPTFQNAVVLITGGSRGLGLELARRFAAEGARIALVARDEAALDRAASELNRRGARVLTVAADVRDQEDVQRAIGSVVAHYGALDVLVNNAGIIVSAPLEEMTIADFDEAMRVHYWGPLFTMQAAFPHLRRSSAPRIVNIASIGGKVAVPHLSAYSGSKFALVGLSDAFRAELAQYGIRVTTVCPGLMRTGSPINATFKGQHAREFTWFSVSDSMPLMSVSSVRAARQIVEACRAGAASLVIGLPAKLAVAMQGVAPNVTAALTAAAGRLLPGPNPQDGAQPRLGRASAAGSPARWARRLVERAARRNNEALPALPITASTTARPF